MEIAALDREAEAAASDYQRLLELDAQRQPLREKLDGLYAEWEALSE